ncbi:MAG: hypothetical protein ACR2HZ_07785 [Gemmatimonadaceae bacterium]
MEKESGRAATYSAAKKVAAAAGIATTAHAEADWHTGAVCCSSQPSPVWPVWPVVSPADIGMPAIAADCRWLSLVAA